MVADEDNIRRRFQRLHGLTERPLQPFERSLQGAEFAGSWQHLPIALRQTSSIGSQDEGLRTKGFPTARDPSRDCSLGKHRGKECVIERNTKWRQDQKREGKG